MLSRLAAGEDPLELSIENWRDIVEYLQNIEQFDEYNKNIISDCPLCEAYPNCIGCPIAKEVGGCWATPYLTYINQARLEDLEGMRNAAREMLKFLKSLREGRKRK